MEIKVINRVKRKYIKTIKKLNNEIKNKDIEPSNLVNYMNQVYFILKSFHKLEEDIKKLNKSIENNKKVNLKNYLKKDKEEQLINNTLETFKPYIFAHYLLSTETYSR
jgi:hypothetical protein